MNVRIRFLILPLILSTFFLCACKSPGPKKQEEEKEQITLSPGQCMEKVIALDDSLGTVRNHACETISLSETIRQYAKGIENIDFEGCPEDFTTAFEKHRQAWLDMLPLVEKYPDQRGEMHDIFDIIEKGDHADAFEPLLKAVWDTWAEVEAAMKG